MRDILTTLERWAAAGTGAAIATVARVERSTPRGPGAAMAVADTGEIAGSVTGGCVEPDVIAHAQAVLGGEPPRLATYGIADADAFAVGLPCGGSVDVMVESLDPEVVRRVARAVREERPVAYATVVAGPGLGSRRVIEGTEPEGDDDALAGVARELLARGESAVVDVGDDRVLVSAMAPRPELYVFGAIDFASALATVGRFLGYRVIVCDPRTAFVTPERFPDADELLTEWPHDLLAERTLDERAAVCVLTHDEKFDVPALRAALATPAGFVGAMGSRRVTGRRTEQLREAGVAEEDLARVHAPIGLPVGAKTPEEVAVSIAAEIIATVRGRHVEEGAREARARV